MDSGAPRWTRSRAGGAVAAALLAGVLLAWATWLVARDRELGDIPGNERTAMFVLKFLGACEAEFRAHDLDRNGVQDFWTGDVATLLAALPPGTFSTGLDADMFGAVMAERAALSRADPSRTDALPYRGYWFVPLDTNGAVGRRHPTAFAFGATPAVFGRTGRNVFINNEMNSVLVRSSRSGPDLPRTWPGDDLRKQWAMPQ